MKAFYLSLGTVILVTLCVLISLVQESEPSVGLLSGYLLVILLTLLIVPAALMFFGKSVRAYLVRTWIDDHEQDLRSVLNIGGAQISIMRHYR